MAFGDETEDLELAAGEPARAGRAGRLRFRGGWPADRAWRASEVDRMVERLAHRRGDVVGMRGLDDVGGGASGERGVDVSRVMVPRKHDRPKGRREVLARRMTSKPSGSPGGVSSSSVRSRGWLRSIAAMASLEEDVLSTIVAPIRPRTNSTASSQIGWGSSTTASSAPIVCLSMSIAALGLTSKTYRSGVGIFQEVLTEPT